MKRVVIPKEASGMKLLDYLNQNAVFLHAACGGKGTCGKCLVRVIDGCFASLFRTNEVLNTDENGYLLACRALCCDTGAVIEVPTADGAGLMIEESARDRYSDDLFGVALDVGTTTLAAALVEVNTQTVIATASALNPQSGFGADVMSRIAACGEGHLDMMQKLLLGEVAWLCQTLLEKAGLTCDTRLSEICVAGNPTMLHIFCGVSPVSMGRYPFTPVFLDTKRMAGEKLGLLCDEVTILPSASSFIGSDVIGGALTQRMLEKDEPTLLLDIGTNGEMLLCTGKKRGNQLFAASAAAGPAFEGANISCGMGGVAGAVCKIEFAKGDTAPVFYTVGDAKPQGLCGSGLVDFACYLLESGQMDETGYTEKESIPLIGYHKTQNGKRFTKANVILQDQDIRSLQLAKSAMRAALETLVDHAGISLADIEATYLAGGLGCYVNKASAAAIGLLPRELIPVAVSVGNTALAGAVYCLSHEKGCDEMQSVAACCHTVELNNMAMFSELFLEHMTFPVRKND